MRLGTPWRQMWLMSNLQVQMSAQSSDITHVLFLMLVWNLGLTCIIIVINTCCGFAYATHVLVLELDA